MWLKYCRYDVKTYSIIPSLITIKFQEILFQRRCDDKMRKYNIYFLPNGFVQKERNSQKIWDPSYRRICNSTQYVPIIYMVSRNSVGRFQKSCNGNILVKFQISNRHFKNA